MTFKRIATEPVAPAAPKGSFLCGNCNSTLDHVVVDAGDAYGGGGIGEMGRVFTGLKFKVHRGPLTNGLVVSPQNSTTVARVNGMGMSVGPMNRKVAEYLRGQDTATCPYCGGEVVI